MNSLCEQKKKSATDDLFLSSVQTEAMLRGANEPTQAYNVHTYAHTHAHCKIGVKQCVWTLKDLLMSDY